MAADYDRNFTQTLIGGAMRRAVWSRCTARFARGSRILEMNCGTGEDARWLAEAGIRVLATDASSAMLQLARAKLSPVRGAAPVEFCQLTWENLGTLSDGPFDGLLSNFGGLNCVADLPEAARSAAVKLRPGAVVILCVMGPLVPWEWIWYTARGAPRKAVRRLRRGGVPWSGITIHYPSIAKARSAFADNFRPLRVAALGALLPPPYTEKWMQRFPRLLRTLNRIERRAETLWPLPQLADHYVLELERV